MSYSRRTVTDGVTIMNKDLYDNLQDGIDEALKQENNAGFHNSRYRGYNLGSSLTTEQKQAISSGKFTDMFIGDYWVINNVIWRIAAFNYWLRVGDGTNNDLTTSHVVIIPDKNLYNYVMNSGDSTSGAYVGSLMYLSGLDEAKNIIKNAFGEDNILTHKEYLTNAVASNYANAGAWYDSQVELMNENMVYGSAIFRPQNSLGTIPNSQLDSKSQLPIFLFRPDFISNRNDYWLRDVVKSTHFALVTSSGYAHAVAAGNSLGVRPIFGIKG